MSRNIGSTGCDFCEGVVCLVEERRRRASHGGRMNRRGKRFGWKSTGNNDCWFYGDDAHLRTGKLEGLLGRVVRIHGGLHSRFQPQLLVETESETLRAAIAPAKRSLWAAQEIVMVEIARLRLGGEP